MRTIPLLIGLTAIIFLSFTGNATAASAGVVNVSAAAFHTVVLTDDGTVWTWGWENTRWGVLGTGNDQSDGSLRRVSSLTGIVAIDAKFESSLAIDNTGRVWAWGDNAYGQCGNVAGASCPSPVQVAGLANIVQVSDGGLNCAAVDKDGHVWTWGDNLYGQLGTGMTGPPQNQPWRVPIEDVKMVSAGSGYTVALKNDGTVWAWGENDQGMAGGSGSDNVLSPRKVQGLWGITKIDAGYDHTLALRNDGTVWAWGDGEENKIGNGDGYYGTVAVRSPVQVNGLPFIVDISAGDHSSMALDRDGNVYDWGSNGDGQYGNGIDLWLPAQSPVKVPGLGDVVSISTGLGHSAVVKKDGSVWAWGRNLEDQVQPGKGKKVMTPLQKIEAGKTMASQAQTQAPTAAASSSSSGAGTDISFYVTAAGVVLLALAIIGGIVLLRMRK